MNKDTINKDTINKDTMNKDTMNKDTTNKDTIKKKKSYKDDRKLKMIEDNIIRRTFKYLYEKFDLRSIQESTIYRHTHDTFIFLISFIVLFSTNLSHLVIIFIIVSFDAISIVMLHGCPLTALERKYIKRSSCDDRDELLNAIGISYNCNHEYEKQVELLINVWMMVAGKCMCIIGLKMFNVKLFNYNNIYSN